MMTEVVITDRARLQFRSILRYLKASFGAKTAQRAIDILQAFERSISHFPEIHPVFDRQTQTRKAVLKGRHVGVLSSLPDSHPGDRLYSHLPKLLARRRQLTYIKPIMEKTYTIEFESDAQRAEFETLLQEMGVAYQEMETNLAQEPNTAYGAVDPELLEMTSADKQAIDQSIEQFEQGEYVTLDALKRKLKKRRKHV